ncbi:MAG: adenylosuccinate lyase family protein [Rhodobacteraceae bacterium]|nr:adenylosuccinate lyase family protein [Paracoccaceae bacterium]
MTASAFDSAIYRDLLGDAEVGALLSDSAEVRAMLLAEGALARAQGGLGLIPEVSAAFIHRAALEVQIDPAALAPETGQNGVPVPGLVAAFRRAMQAPAHAAFVHWGATSQDIHDTGLILRLRQALVILEERLLAVIGALGALADDQADLPVAARTYAQVATPTTFGAIVASWGAPLIRHRARLVELRPRLLNVSLSGAAGTLSVMGGKGAEVRAAMARDLALHDPGESWHSTRDGMAELGGWLTMLTASLGKIGEDMIWLTQSGIAEVRLGGGGGSSTMPQKQNPVAPSLLVTLARFVNGLNGAMQGAALHRQQRDATAWFTEWLVLPQMLLGGARALAVTRAMVPQIAPDAARMRAGIDDGLGLIYAEALSFALARTMARPQAQAAVKALCKEAQATNTPLATLAARDWPDTDWATTLTPEAQLGEAPHIARAFARAARTLTE